ncbi:MAG: hypothetical protein DRR06_09905 [Gammaproteobacteria bacterium]|nr:MAG: hypothetical protein DRR06_09905 [Gammaproteobacteria bacterium]
MSKLDEQDLGLLVELVVGAEAQEILLGALSKNNPTTRMVYLKQLEMKLLKMKSLAGAPDLAEKIMLDGRQPPGMGDTQADERY